MPKVESSNPSRVKNNDFKKCIFVATYTGTLHYQDSAKTAQDNMTEMKGGIRYSAGGIDSQWGGTIKSP